MKEIKRQSFSEERALFAASDLIVSDCTFDVGESPLKESRNITVFGSSFLWRYPLWYSHRVTVDCCKLSEPARAGVWYSGDITVRHSVVQAPKCFRRCQNLILDDVSFPACPETLWDCRGVKLRNVTASGDYFALNSQDIDVDHLDLNGKYAFDGVRNVTVRNSRLITKDAFWNSENVTVSDSVVVGEYIGWNSRNLTFVNCSIQSLQGLCYIDNLVLKNCKLDGTSLAFEYSTVDADITSGVDSILNPGGGTIRADSIGELILERDRIDPGKLRIICRDVKKQSDRLIW